MSDLVEKRQEELKNKKICRFCLSQESDNLTNIYSRENRLNTAPLPLQVMACVSIEVFSNDSMPGFICSECRLLFDYCYRFKQMCKKADTSLRHYPLTGVWASVMEKPKASIEMLKPRGSIEMLKPRASIENLKKQTPSPKKQPTNLNSLQVPRKINSQTTLKIDLDDEGSKATLRLDEFEHPQTEPQEPQEEVEVVQTKPKTHQKPHARSLLERMKPTKKLLNKSAVRILNKEIQQEKEYEPRMTRPVLKRDNDGNFAVVSEILDLSDTPAGDWVDDAAVIKTNVFPCPHCERSFPLRQLLDIHMVNHNRERSFLCSHCDKSFFSKYDLQKHFLVHTGEKPYKCVVCSKGFTRSTLLHRHEKTHTDIPKFICVFCEKPFISQEEMEKHTARHRKKRPFTCKICRKSFAFKQGLERHEVVHSRVQPFQCQYCEKSFATPSKLTRHLTAHAGTRPYPCKLCHKSYLLSHHLSRHMRSHKNGLSCYKCNDCDKTFTKRDDLIYHSAVHATQTLVCPLCKDPFKSIETVTEHVKQHAEGEAFACEFCDLIYMTAERLQEHTDAEHVDEMVVYNEDENTNQPKIRNEAMNVDSDSANQDIDDVIEEFLIDELSDNGKEEVDEKVFLDHGKKEVDEKVSSVIVKEETDWQTPGEDNELDESDKVDTSQEKDGNDTGDERDDPYLNIMEENESVYEPPAKVVKISPINNKIVKLSTPALTRRQVPPKQSVHTTVLTFDSSLPKENKNPILKASPMSRLKIEKIATLDSPAVSKTRQPTIQAALQGLPKSLSVKMIEGQVKSTPHAESIKAVTAPSTPFIKPLTPVAKPAPKAATTTQSASKPKPSPQPKQMPLRLRSETCPNKKPPEKASTSLLNTEQPKKTALKSDLVASKNLTIPEGLVGEKKIVEMMIGDKKVKVQRITMSKAQAAAMAREGRIQMKEGTMILKKDRNQSSSRGARNSN